MFSSEAQLKRRTPINGTDRENFLTLLVDEYLNSTSIDAKCQILANLANFAYDPINYCFIRDVGVLDIFFHVIKHENNQKFLQFATAGVCNLCLDPLNAEYILTHLGLKPIIELLKSDQNDTVADVITTLIYLYNNDTKALLVEPAVISKMQDIEMCNDKKLSSLATIFLQQVSEANKFPYFVANNKNYQKICKISTSSFCNTAFKAGDKIRIQKTLTQKDLDAFSNLTSDHNYLHQNNGNKRPIVHGALLNGLVAGLIGTHLPGPGTVLVSQTMKFPNKCFVGEKLTISVELVDVRKILKVKFYCIVEEEKKVVFEGEAKLMLAKDS
ncbi:hypothetical protein K1T71_003379 [Dendrolimus kikuchii]|uniref:Uncharacterized protein n=1 Tax=Dendrolimus kikuchii TaxID=765133 RepID=A0ACC1DBE7_9NEOP|nr:hypothetical protein K1T71_003379 [Dendrolimus kikuchii]